MSEIHKKKAGMFGLVNAALVASAMFSGSAFADATLAAQADLLATAPQQLQLQAQYEISQVKVAIEGKHARWNAGETTMTAMSQADRRARLGLLKDPSPGRSYTNMLYAAPMAPPGASVVLPANFDWRNYNGHNYVTPVRDQGQCGSCWAFSVTAALEAKALITLNTPDTDLNLAEKIVLSCSGAGTCGGGWPDKAANFLVSSGDAGESNYPYSASNGQCSAAAANWKDGAYKLSDWHYVVQNAKPSVDTIKNALYNSGPLVTTLDVYADFYAYKSGVYSHTSGVYEGGHAVLITGWSDADQAFIVKNSWGTGWGDHGYLKIAYSELTGTTKFTNQMTLAYGTVAAPGVHCVYAIDTSGATVAATASSGSVKVTPASSATCGWSATSSASWLTVTAGASGSGAGTVSYAVAANTGAARSATLTIAGQTYTVNQAGSGTPTPVCTLSASPSVIDAGKSSTLTASCSPAATSYKWTNSGFGNTTASGAVTPAASTTYSVVGSNAAGAGNVASATVTVAKATGPLTPTNLIAPVNSTTTPLNTYSWNASMNATSYTLYVRTFFGVDVFTETYTASSLGCAAGTGTCSIKPTKATPAGAFYTWSVRASNAAGTSPWSATKTFYVWSK